MIDDMIKVIADPVLYKDDVADNAINMLLNMAQSKTTHKHLFNEKVVAGVLSSLEKRHLDQEHILSAQIIL